MKVFVTGANGFLATHIIIELVRARIKLKGLIRDRQKFLLPDHELIEFAEGDLTDAKFIEEVLSDCTHVVHIAALTSQRVNSYEEYRKINVEGTENVLRASQKYGIKRMIYVSTANTLGYGSKEEPGNEEAPFKKPFKDSLYASSKWEAQEMIKSATNELDIITVHPTFMLGAYDSAPSSGQIIRMAFGKKIVFYPPGGKNFVHVQDVALGILQILRNGEKGEKYLISNENLSYKEFYMKVAETSNHKPFLVKIPVFILLTMGCIGSAMRHLGARTSLSLTNMKILCVNNYYSNTKVTRLLDFKFQSTDLAIKEAIDWFKENRMI